MSDTQRNILSVDDERTNQLIVKKLLSDDFTLSLASSGEECLAILSEVQPELILLDVNMPGIDGYETCSKIREHSDFKETPIIFLSGRSKSEDRLKGYEVGGNDYVTKPCNFRELKAKIDRTFQEKQKNDELSERLQQSTKVAFQAMSYSSQLGRVIQLLGETSQCEYPEQIGEAIFHLLESIGLKCSLRIHHEETAINMCNSGVVNTLEALALEKACNKTRIFDLGDKTFFNQTNITLLIKNMPKDDPEKYGMLKDLIQTLLIGIELKLDNIFAQQRLQSKRVELFDIVRSTLDKLDQGFQLVRNRGTENIEKICSDIEKAVDDLNMNELQEDEILKITQSGMDISQNIFAKSRRFSR
jgi:CheY-like chemotaxis protein